MDGLKSRNNFVLDNAINAYEHTADSALDRVTLDFLKELREYRKSEEQGLLLRLPCKVGTTVYCIENECEDMYIEGSDYLFVAEEKFDYWMIEHFGKEVFLTQEEAEQALKRMESE